jgi:hypothetical protein
MVVLSKHIQQVVSVGIKFLMAKAIFLHQTKSRTFWLILDFALIIFCFPDFSRLPGFTVKAATLIVAMSFDRTAANTGYLNDACVSQQQKHDQKMRLSCWHHVLEILRGKA